VEPWPGHVPEVGTLHPADADALAAALARHTSAPERCWFCTWDGWGSWWPDDRAWCVATEIDLGWTYVGGSAALISDVVANPRLEAQPASPHDMLRRAPEWLVPTIEAASTELLDSGTTTLDTWRGTVDAQLELPHGQTDGDLRIQRRPSNGFAGSSWSLMNEHDPARLRDNVMTALTSAVIELL
jgi:hypothetical protein